MRRPSLHFIATVKALATIPGVTISEKGQRALDTVRGQSVPSLADLEPQSRNAWPPLDADCHAPDECGDDDLRHGQARPNRREWE